MTPIKAAADMSREFAEELRKYWSFDNDQMHTHSWHDRENFIARKLPSLLAKFAPAGNAGVRERLETIANEVIGIQEDLPSEDDRNTLGFAAHYLRKFAALPQPREAEPVTPITNPLVLPAGIKAGDYASPSPIPEAPVGREERPTAFLAWAVDMFGPVAKLRSERLLRFVEEAIELAHAEGMERNVLNRVAERVYSRFAGDTPKEIGQAQACLETFAENIGLSSAGEAQREWERVQTIPRDEWARRHSAKQAIGIALKPQDGGNCEHGIAKVNCGVCVPSEVFSGGAGR